MGSKEPIKSHGTQQDISSYEQLQKVAKELHTDPHFKSLFSKEVETKSVPSTISKPEDLIPLFLKELDTKLRSDFESLGSLTSFEQFEKNLIKMIDQGNPKVNKYLGKALLTIAGKFESEIDRPELYQVKERIMSLYHATQYEPILVLRQHFVKETGGFQISLPQEPEAGRFKAEYDNLRKIYNQLPALQNKDIIQDPMIWIDQRKQDAVKICHLLKPKELQNKIDQLSKDRDRIKRLLKISTTDQETNTKALKEVESLLTAYQALHNKALKIQDELFVYSEIRAAMSPPTPSLSTPAINLALGNGQRQESPAATPKIDQTVKKVGNGLAQPASRRGVIYGSQTGHFGDKPAEIQQSDQHHGSSLTFRKQ